MEPLSTQLRRRVSKGGQRRGATETVSGLLQASSKGSCEGRCARVQAARTTWSANKRTTSVPTVSSRVPVSTVVGVRCCVGAWSALVTRHGCCQKHGCPYLFSSFYGIGVYNTGTRYIFLSIYEKGQEKTIAPRGRPELARGRPAWSAEVAPGGTTCAAQAGRRLPPPPLAHLHHSKNPP